jgi:isopenicillin N synthase-like dioxygenase
MMSPSDRQQDAIPVIDISSPSDDIAQQVLDAASTHGFLYIKSDGVTIRPQDIDDMFTLVSSRLATRFSDV